jgi:uncharacterized glyoxalase superfamily protein PhnB
VGAPWYNFEMAASAGSPIPCEGCGFVYDLDAAADAGATILVTAAQLSAIIGAGDASVRRRPDSDTWSILEYGCHVRDVLLVQRERVLLALRVEEPNVETMGRDERVEADDYIDQQPVDVARQLGDAALLFSGVLGRLDERGWQRTLIYNYPDRATRTLAWVAVHTVHELVHHLGDVQRQLGQLDVANTVNNQRAGFHSVTPRIVVRNVEAQVDFLRTVFDATGEVPGGRPAEIHIGDSLIMVTSATDRELFPAFLYVYVDEVERCYQRALAAGAITIEPPLDTPYGDRRAMVRDPFGNIFQIAQSNESAKRLS